MATVEIQAGLKPLFQKLIALLPDLIASRQPWRMVLNGKGASVKLEITRFDDVLVRPAEPEHVPSVERPHEILYRAGEN